MSKKMINRTHVEGFLYEHDLDMKVTGDKSKNPGTTYISGNINIATDNECLNIVPVHFSYVTASTKTGKPNATFTVLQNIIDGNYKSIMEHGKDTAVKLRIDSVIGLNEFYSDNNGKECELVSVKRNEGGFIHVTPTLEEKEEARNTFECDMVINKVRRLEADEEKGLAEKVIVSGAVFDFRNSILPVEFVATNPNAMDYFESLELPVFTKVSGNQISETIVKTYTEESAFGEPMVREVKSSRKEFLITRASKETYEWDSEDSITVNEINEAITNREIYLADVKRRYLEYKNGGAAAPAKPAISNNGGFNF